VPALPSNPSLADPVPSDVTATAPEQPALAAPSKPESEKTAQPVKPDGEKPVQLAQAKPATVEPPKPTAPSVTPPAPEARRPEPIVPAPAARETPPQSAANPQPLPPSPSPADTIRQQPPAEIVVRRPKSPDAGMPVAKAEKPVSESPPAQADSEDGSLFGLVTSPTGLAVIGGVAAALALLAIRRRRAAEDDDPLYSVMSAEDAGASAGYGAWNHEGSSAEEPANAEARSFDSDEPVSHDGSQQLGLGRPRIVPPPDSIFEAEPSSAPASEPTPVVVTPGAGSYEASNGDVSRAATDLANRVAALERRVEQLAEARERIERQVAAQTEELRVQRAAIARTQRVVRSMSKGEDVATEPVPRNL
jgi:hypothetical protein